MASPVIPGFPVMLKTSAQLLINNAGAAIVQHEMVIRSALA
jgi:hypothetical protein